MKLYTLWGQLEKGRPVFLLDAVDEAAMEAEGRPEGWDHYAAAYPTREAVITVEVEPIVAAFDTPEVEGTVE